MKIAIIGAGSCGLYLAGALAKNKHEVTVFEKKDNLSNKACSGLFSERILDFVPQSEKLTENKIKSVIVNFPNKKSKVDFSKSFLVMDRSKLDNLLLDLAISAGAKILFNRHIKKTPTGFDKVIACDGAESEIRKQLGLKNPPLRLGIQGLPRRVRPPKKLKILLRFGRVKTDFYGKSQGVKILSTEYWQI